MSHDHGAREPISGWRLLVTMLLNFAIAIAELVGGVLAGSISLVADALHNFSDGVAVVISYGAIRLRRRENSPRLTFGLKRAEILAALINATVLVGISLYLFIEAARRLATPTVVRGDIMTAVAVVGLLANVVGVLLLRSGARNSLNIRSTYLHLVADAASSVGVVLGGIAIYVWNVYWVDPVLTIIIGVVVLKESYAIVSETIHIFMEGAPAYVDLEEIRATVEAVAGVVNIHHVHVWTVGENDVHIQGHLNIDDMMLSEADKLRCVVEKLLRDSFELNHVTLQLECEGCREVGLTA